MNSENNPIHVCLLANLIVRMPAMQPTEIHRNNKNNKKRTKPNTNPKPKHTHQKVR